MHDATGHREGANEGRVRGEATDNVDGRDNAEARKEGPPPHGSHPGAATKPDARQNAAGAGTCARTLSPKRQTCEFNLDVFGA